MLIKFRGSDPLSWQLYRALRAAILSGTYAPGSRLPSTRALAVEAGVSRNTVLLAYDQLLHEGYVTGQRGSGTYVAAELPDQATVTVRPAERPSARARRVTPRLSQFGQRTRGWNPSWEPPSSRVPYDFRYGRPGFADFPHATWRRLLARCARRATARDLDYGPAAGVSGLRAEIAAYLQRARAVTCTPQQVIVVSGSQQGLDLVARVMVDAGDKVLLEEPHYPGARGVFLAAGAEVVTAPVAADGVNITALGPAMKRVRLAYVTPSHQYPTGAIMSLTRRLALLAWAETVNAYIVEDDYDSEYRYAGRPVESLQGLDRAGRVIYLGTFSKLLFPALRLGYLVLPEALVQPFVTAKALNDTGGARLEQLVLADFIREGHFERHIRRSRARNAARRAVLLEAIAEHFGDRVEVAGANAGIHVLLWVRGISSRRAKSRLARAEQQGVRVYPVAPCYVTEPPGVGLLLGYGGLTEEQIRIGIRRLATVLG